MVGIELEGSVLNTPFSTFATSLLPLYSGPTVKIRVESASHEYILPKALLCTQVPYFADMFQENRFKEGAELSTELGRIDGVVSTRSVEMLVQWVCHNRIVFREGDLSPAEAIGASIEFARFADMCRITGLETMMAEHIKQIILANKPPPESVFVTPLDDHSFHLTLEHIESGVLLPKGHAVRKMLVSAMLKGYLLRRPHQDLKEIEELPDFAVDLLKEVDVALRSLQTEKRGMTFEDPFSGQRVHLNSGL